MKNVLPMYLGGTFSFTHLRDKKLCNSLKISMGRQWKDVEEVGTPGM
jgi:hypothetical protein